MAYFLLLAIAAIALLPFYEDLPQTYVFGFGLFSLPTLPIVKVIFPVFENALAIDSLMLILIFCVALIYAAAAKVLIIFLDNRDTQGSSTGSPTGFEQ